MTIILQTYLVSLKVSDGNQSFIWQGECGIEKSTTRQWVNPGWACRFCSWTSARRIICYARILQELVFSCRDCGPIYSRCLLNASVFVNVKLAAFLTVLTIVCYSTSLRVCTHAWHFWPLYTLAFLFLCAGPCQCQMRFNAQTDECNAGIVSLGWRFLISFVEFHFWSQESHLLSCVSIMCQWQRQLQLIAIVGCDLCGELCGRENDPHKV